MAHRSNVIQVPRDYDLASQTELITDPVCGKEMSRKEVRHVLIRGDAIYFFCSWEHLSQFTSHSVSREKAS